MNGFFSVECVLTTSDNCIYSHFFVSGAEITFFLVLLLEKLVTCSANYLLYANAG